MCVLLIHKEMQEVTYIMMNINEWNFHVRPMVFSNLYCRNLFLLNLLKLLNYTKLIPVIIFVA